MKYNVCVVTGTRAEYGLLRQLLFKFRTAEEINLTLLVTGSHLSSKFGNTQQEIKDDGFIEYVKIPIPIDDDTKEGMAYSAGVALLKFAEYFKDNKPDMLIVLGDRFEVFSATAAAHLIGIPIAHISGGDVTLGAVDDAIRHCITKMSILHFPGCEQSRKRIIQMGEQPNRVYNVGEPGVENCLKMELLSREELAKSISFDNIKKDYAVVTFHPVTMKNNIAEKQIYELIRAMDSFDNMAYIITLANADAGGRRINEIWIKEGKMRNNWKVVPSLGVLRYLSALKYCKLVIGNSSSGIVEAPSMKIPTVNIGDRQQGRMMAESVICCGPEYEAIKSAMALGMSDKFCSIFGKMVSPFGNGTTSEQIFNKIIEYLYSQNNTTEKQFYNIKF